MKIVLTVCLIFILSMAHADEKGIHAHSAPTVKFVFLGITVYTDTASLFHELSDDDHDIKVMVLHRLLQSKNDTATFRGDCFSFNDSLNSDSTPYIDKYQNWYPYYTLLPLMKERRATIVDAKGVRVKHFITRREGSKAEGRIRLIYMNRANHERLFAEILYISLICPKF
jgi:hypothetical protein